MTDREKVIKVLQCCATGGRCGHNGNSPTCPYFKKSSKAGACVGRLIDDACDLMKEQEPVRPIEREGFWYCGACKYAFTSARQKFCSDCGRAVKWE